jgi:general secretion pathway protein G
VTDPISSLKPAEPAPRDAGFTLLELLVVIAILGLLVAFVAPQALKTLGYAKSSIAKQEITEFGSYFERYALDVGRYPTTEEGIAALTEKPSDVDNWNGPYIKGGAAQKDPWNHPWIYRSPSTRPGQRDYDFCSPGPTGKGTEPGEGDVICNP